MSQTPLLDTINLPQDLRRLDKKQLPQIAAELRAFLLDSIGKTGGHFASNLGAVELTIALHYVYDTPEDKWFGMSAIKAIRTKSLPAAKIKCTPCAATAVWRVFPNAASPNMTRLA